MAAPIPLRPDFDAARLRSLAKRARDPDQTRRLLAPAAIYDGATRSEAARIGAVTLQIVRDYILDHCCEAWNKLVDRPWLIMSIGLRDWAHEF